MGASVAPLSEGVASQAAALPGCVAVAFHPRLGRCCGRRSLAMTAGRVSGVRQHKRFVALADDVAPVLRERRSAAHMSARRHGFPPIS
jgi:hypothetical protein